MKLRYIFIFLLVICTLGGIYRFHHRTLTNTEILAYGWKGGVCTDAPDVLDFRHGKMRIEDDTIFVNNREIGRIVKRQYRSYADAYIEILNSTTGEICTYWAKWKN